MSMRILPALGALFTSLTAHAHPGHPALSTQHVHVGGQADVVWFGLLIVAALFAVVGIGRALARSATRRQR